MHKKTRTLLKLLLSLILVVLFSACVSTAKFEAMVNERDMMMKERDTAREEKASVDEQLNMLRKDHNQLSSRLAETEQEKQVVTEQAAQAEQEKQAAAEKAEQAEREKQAAAEKAEQAEAELARQRNVFSKLQDTFAKEQQANQVKIELLKSGIKVNLANEILFSSGSSTLNAQGQEVLRRAAADLKDSPYQILVAGFTDNVAISGNLKKKFPSNWELAGARAASVVRILEDEGAPSEQLLMISLGENQPVESNDTPEGRAKNRRIEIMLRPVPVTLD
jgi:chemotaxis protein MotB